MSAILRGGGLEKSRTAKKSKDSLRKAEEQPNRQLPASPEQTPTARQLSMGAAMCFGGAAQGGSPGRSEADLGRATVTNKQLAKAKSLEGMILPNGAVHK